MSDFSQLLPPLHARWVGELLGASVPPESEATCDDCAMRPPPGEAATDAHFDAKTKCCTYLPVLRNFLAGGVLRDPLADTDAAAAHGRATLRARIAARDAVTPFAVERPAAYSFAYGTRGAFGHSAGLRCPHYVEDGERCGVWRHREATCATWFCKHVRGNVGARFWREGVELLLGTAERAVAIHCILQLGVGDDALGALLPRLAELGGSVPSAAGADGRVDEDRYRALWGSWAGREEDFYRACAEIAASLSWRDVLALGGAPLAARAQLARAAHARLLSSDVPSHLRAAPVEVARWEGGTVRLRTYSRYDPLDVPRALLDALPHFDGRPTADAVRAAAAAGVVIDEETVRTLVDFEVLVPPGEAASEGRAKDGR
jgi:hypothetical protein